MQKMIYKRRLGWIEHTLRKTYKHQQISALLEPAGKEKKRSAKKHLAPRT